MSVELLGFNVDTYRFEEAIACAKSLIDGNKVSQIITINPEMFECANKDNEFALILKDAEMVIPDGVGVYAALKICGYKAERIPGIDFALSLLKETACNDIPVAIIGSKSDVIESAIQNLKKQISGLNIVYYHDGYFNDDNEIYSELLKATPKLVLVAMGSPKQEKFIYNAKKILKPCVMAGIGGSLDVWSGKVKRAPKIFRVVGLEWLYRICTQPSRIKRVLPTLPKFILRVLNYKYTK